MYNQIEKYRATNTTGGSKMAAGENEKKFEEFFQRKYKNTELNGKQRYCDDITKTEISVDNSIISKNHNILIEIDSGNEAKLIVGQYVLLNQLYQDENKDTLFLVIHYHIQNKNKPTERPYNADRTIKNLIFINNSLYDGKGLKFCVFNEYDFKLFCNKYSRYSSFEKYLFKLAEKQMNSINPDGN